MARIGLGTVQFGLPYGISNASGQVAEGDAAAILARAAASGIRDLDTAAAYGTAEEVLGRILPRPSPFRIVTKTLRLSEGLPAVVAGARRSVERLGVRPVEALMVHSAGDLEGSEGDRLWRALSDLCDEGLFARLGISAYAADDPAALAARFAPGLMQLPVSLLDQRLVESGALSAIRTRGIEIHARSIFLQGLLFRNPARLPERLAHGAPRLEAVHAGLRETGLTPVRAAVAFALAQPDIGVAMTGVTSIPELEDILEAASSPAADIDWRRFSLSDEMLLDPARW